jgi:diacylglycerol kinase family enzyme
MVNSSPGLPVSVVLNGAAGALLDSPKAHEALDAQLRAAGFAPEFVPPDSGSLPERLGRASKSGAQMVIVGGGDGTIACAAECAAAAGVTLGILPFGTMNMLATDLGIPSGDTEAAIAVLRDGEARAIDAAEVNGRLFLCASMLGLPARLARYREAARGKGLAPRLWLKFLRALVRGAARYRPPRILMRIDGQEVEMRLASLTISVNPVDITLGRALSRSSLDGGTLGLYGVRRMRLVDMFRFAARALIGRLEEDSDIHIQSAQTVEILRMGRLRRRTIRVMNDGEVILMSPPLRYRVIPGHLLVMAPRRPAAELPAT